MNIKENFKVSRQLTNYYDNFNKFLLIKHNKICSMTLLHLYLLRNPYRLYDKNLIKLIFSYLDNDNYIKGIIYEIKEKNEILINEMLINELKFINTCCVTMVYSGTRMFYCT